MSDLPTHARVVIVGGGIMGVGLAYHLGHEGWGGENGTALHRIGSTLTLRPLVFWDNARTNRVWRAEATELLGELARSSSTETRLDENAVVYLDPPYNQHPYASNYHLLNTLTLWDSPPLSPRITRGDKAAIRTDWTERRSPYNHRRAAAEAFEGVLDAALEAGTRHVLVSYSTDGMIPLPRLVTACAERGEVDFLKAPYKRYRVSPTRPSRKPLNVEFVLVLDLRRRPSDPARTAEAIVDGLLRAEAQALAEHREGPGSGQSPDT